MDKIYRAAIIASIVVASKLLYLWIKNYLDKREQDAIDNRIIGSEQTAKVAPDEIPIVSSEDLAREMMNASCAFLTQENQKKIINFNKIDISMLDFSVSSLDEIDLWMVSVWQSKSTVDSDSLEDTLLWVGSYVGEVIRRNSPKRFRWIGYREFIEKYGKSNMNIMPYSFEYQYILDGSNNVASFPFSKVSKYMDNGPEENLKYFAMHWCGKA